MGPDQGGPHLLAYCFSHVSGRRGGRLGGLVRQLTRQVVPDVPDAPLLLRPGQRLTQKGAQALGAITDYAANAAPVQPRLTCPLKKTLSGRRLVFPLGDHRQPQQPCHTVGQQQHCPGRRLSAPGAEPCCCGCSVLAGDLQMAQCTQPVKLRISRRQREIHPRVAP